MEAELREGVMATLDAIAAEFEKLPPAAGRSWSKPALQGEDLSPTQDRKAYEKLQRTPSSST